MSEIALGYQPPPGPCGAIRVEAHGSHRVTAGSQACKTELLAAMLLLKPQNGARLVVLGADVDELRGAERAALRPRIAYVPANGGLLSHLNCWENIVLPLGFHDPKRLRGTEERVQALLDELGGVEPGLLAKLPEEMTLYEKRLAAYIRTLLGSPELLVVDDLAAGLGPTKRRRTQRFGEAYHARCPGGTFVELDAEEV